MHFVAGGFGSCGFSWVGLGVSMRFLSGFSLDSRFGFVIQVCLLGWVLCFGCELVVEVLVLLSVVGGFYAGLGVIFGLGWLVVVVTGWWFSVISLRVLCWIMFAAGGFGSWFRLSGIWGSAMCPFLV